MACFGEKTAHGSRVSVRARSHCLMARFGEKAVYGESCVGTSEVTYFGGSLYRRRSAREHVCVRQAVTMWKKAFSFFISL